MKKSVCLKIVVGKIIAFLMGWLSKWDKRCRVVDPQPDQEPGE